MQIVQSSLTLSSAPTTPDPEEVNGKWTFQCLSLKFGGTAHLGESTAPMRFPVALAASRSPIGAGWRVGWVQINVQPWNWALYRQTAGQSASLLRWPSYTALDNENRYSYDLFYKMDRPFYQQLNPGQPSASVEFLDMPYVDYAPRLPMPGGDALLSSIGARLEFVCALVARAPDDAMYVLRWIPWYVQWSCDFSPGPGKLVYRVLASGTKAAAGPQRHDSLPILSQVLAKGPGRTAIVMADQSPATTVLNGALIDVELKRLRAG